MLVVAIAIILSIALFSVVNAQTETNDTELILTWEAQNYYPSNYKGKAEVTQRTPVLVSATGTENNSFVNLSEAEFTWYLDGRVYEQGVGLNEIIFESDKSSGDSHFVRVIITLDGTTFRETIRIPVEKSKVVIEYPNISRTLERNRDITLSSTPYFFTVNTFSDLSFYWEINGSLQDEKSRTMTINSNDQDVGSGYNLITSIIANENNQLESIRSNIQINVE